MDGYQILCQILTQIAWSSILNRVSSSPKPHELDLHCPRFSWHLSFQKQHQNSILNSAYSTLKISLAQSSKRLALNPFQMPMTHMVRLNTTAPLLSSNVLYQLRLCLLWQSTWEKHWLWLPVWWSSPLWQRRHSTRNMKSLAIHMYYTWSQEVERNECWGITYFLLFTALGTPVHCMVLVIFKMGLFSSVKTFLKWCHRHTQKCVSTVILNPSHWQLRLKNHIYQDLAGCSNQSPQTWIC